MINNLFIVSGGQTGVDRAALDFSIENGIPCGGWCPKSRIAEDGIIDNKYPLKETETKDYSQRTYRNVKESDAILVFVNEKIDRGTGAAIDFAEQMEKPLYIVHLKMNAEDQAEGIFDWFMENKIQKLNIVGSKESFCPGIYQLTKSFLQRFYTYFQNNVN